MIKKKLLEFRNCVTELVTRRADLAQKAMAWLYVAGDGLVLTIPLVESGFLKSVWNSNPDWHSLATAYGADPAPALVSAIYVAGGIAIGRGRFALGHAAYGVGAALLTLNLHLHHDNWTALATFPTVIGGAFGASYKLLEESFGQARNSFVRNTLGAPKKMAGLSFTFSTGPMIFTSMYDKVWPLVGTGLLCFAGNLISTLLPPDDHPTLPANQYSSKQPALLDKKP